MTDSIQKTKKKKKVFINKSKKGSSEQDIINGLKERYNTINTTEVNSFADLPLSAKTLKGLKECGYLKPTEIQRETIKLALTGCDILGAAKTGSGKTLAFLIPLLEILFCEQWTSLDGLGALVITPTRELAYQIFETLRRIGEHHDLSAGLIIGGKDLKFERNRMDTCNIVICTPGRLLQHMDENPLFSCDNMKVLVLDEADRILDMGFAETMNAIIANLPAVRQTLLFSATQTKSVKDLARLSLKDPRYVSVHENSKHSTPTGLQQNYVVCELHDKVSILWSFMKNHLKQKMIIFFSSCKEVKYMYEIFCKLRPGTSLLALYGTLHQLRRMDIYQSFCNKSSAILFATDLAARGLDFPEVHWVVQADCPEDADTYIHRVGRTARYHRGGESMLMLLPSEIAMVDELEGKKIPINKIEINPDKLHNPVRKIEAILSKNPALKDSAQRAFKSYAKAVFFMKNKNVFKLQEIDTDSYSKSLGLVMPPRIRFLQRMNNAQKATIEPITLNKNKTYFKDSDDDDNEKIVSQDADNEIPFNVPYGSDNEEDFGIWKVNRMDHDIELPTEADLANMGLGRKSKKPITKAALAKKMLSKEIVPNKKIVFDDEGEAVIQSAKEKRSELAQLYDNEDEGGINIEKAKQVLREEDLFDKKLFKEKVKAKHKEAKRKLKEKKKEKEEEQKDDFGTDSEDETPDLSWLPDPDKLYGENDEELPEFFDPTTKNDSSVKDTSSNKIEKGTKRKTNTKLAGINKKKKKRKVEELTADLTVNEAEELASMLLTKNKSQ